MADHSYKLQPATYRPRSSRPKSTQSVSRNLFQFAHRQTDLLTQRDGHSVDDPEDHASDGTGSHALGPSATTVYGAEPDASEPHDDDSSSSDDDSSNSTSEPHDATFWETLEGKHGKSAYKKLKKSIKRNRRRNLDTSKKSKSDSMAIHSLNQMHRSCSDHRAQDKVRMGEYYDRPFSATHCVKRDLVITWNPYIPLALVEAFLRKGPRSKKPTTDALELEVALALQVVWNLLRYREGTALTDRIFDIIDEEDMKPKHLLERLKELHTRMGSDTLLTHDSVLCHRAPNTCYSYC